MAARRFMRHKDVGALVSQIVVVLGPDGRGAERVDQSGYVVLIPAVQARQIVRQLLAPMHPRRVGRLPDARTKGPPQASNTDAGNLDNLGVQSAFRGARV